MGITVVTYVRKKYAVMVELMKISNVMMEIKKVEIYVTLNAKYKFVEMKGWIMERNVMMVI